MALQGQGRPFQLIVLSKSQQAVKIALEDRNEKVEEERVREVKDKVGYNSRKVVCVRVQCVV